MLRNQNYYVCFLKNLAHYISQQIDIELSYVNNGPIIYKKKRKRKIDDIIIFFLLIYDYLVKLYIAHILYARPKKAKTDGER